VAGQPAAVQRLGGAAIGSHAGPPEDLLPSGGSRTAPRHADVERVLAHLAPIRTREALAASYAREGFHRLGGPGPGDDAVTLAYAIRWLDLGRRPSAKRSGGPVEHPLDRLSRVLGAVDGVLEPVR
jgi:hypothetical protein